MGCCEGAETKLAWHDKDIQETIRLRDYGTYFACRNQRCETFEGNPKP